MRPPLVRETSRLTWGLEPSPGEPRAWRAWNHWNRAARPRWPEELDLLEEAGRLPGKDRFGGRFDSFSLSGRHLSRAGRTDGATAVDNQLPGEREEEWNPIQAPT